jgi:ferrous iron transport protein A
MRWQIMGFPNIANLADIPFDAAAHIHGLQPNMLSADEYRRLQSLGFLAGEAVCKIHGGGFGKVDPLAIRIGRTTIALRRRYAAAILVIMDS